MLPEGWKRISLQHIGMVKSGGTPSRKDTKYWGGNIPWITTAELNQNKVSRSNEYITVEGLKNSSAKIFPRGTILVAMYGQGKTRGTSSILGIEAATNQACAAIVCNENINNLYVFQYLQSQYLELRALSNGGSQDNLSLELIKNFEILLPPLPEQEKIAAILSTWDKAISTADAMLENSRQQKKALMQQLLTGKCRLPGFSGEWECGKLTKISYIEKGKPLNGEDIQKGKYPVIAGGKTITAWHNGFTHEDVVTVSASGAYAGFVNYHNCKIWASDCSVISEIKNISYCRYLYYLLLSRQRELYKLQVGGAQPHVYPKDLATIEITSPPLDEQRAIAAVLDAADREIALLEQKAARLREEKKALMQQMLTGKRRVRV